MATGNNGTTSGIWTWRLLESRTTTNGVPSSASDGVEIATIVQGLIPAPRYCDVLVYSTAGSGTMTATIKLWGYSVSRAAWFVLGVGTSGVLNAGAAIAETSSDSISYTEEIAGVLRGYSRLYAEVTAIGGTSTAISVDLLVPMYASERLLSGGDITIDGTLTATAFVGPVTGDTTGTHYGPVGTEAGRTSPAVPANDTAFQSMTGLSAAWWDFSALSGAGSIASSGAVAGTLATSGTLAYGYTLGGQVGVHFDSSTGDAIRAAATLLPGTNSIMFGGRLGFATDPAGTSHTLMGNFRFTGGLPEGVVVRVNDSGNLIIDIGDAAAAHTFSLTAASALMTAGASPIDLIVQLDRSGADPVLRARWSRGGYLLGTAALTCASLGTLTGTSQEIGFGAIPLAAPAYNGGGWVQWGFWATGAQCEGASAAQLVSQGLGFEE